MHVGQTIHLTQRTGRDPIGAESSKRNLGWPEKSFSENSFFYPVMHCYQTHAAKLAATPATLPSSCPSQPLSDLGPSDRSIQSEKENMHRSPIVIIAAVLSGFAAMAHADQLQVGWQLPAFKSDGDTTARSLHAGKKTVAFVYASW